MIGIGDIIVRRGGGPHYRVTAIRSGSWSGDRYYDCRLMSDQRRKETFLYDDQVVLVRKAAEKRSTP